MNNSKGNKLSYRSKVVLSISVVAIILLIIAARTLLFNIVTAKVRFPGDLIGTVYNTHDGQNFKVFRVLTVDSSDYDESAYSVFRVRFRFKGLKEATNKKLSIIPAPFLIGMKGFRQKIWMIDEKTGEFQGVYQWSSEEQAKAYPESFVYNLMTKRAQKDSIVYEVVSGAKINEYLKEKEKQ